MFLLNVKIPIKLDFNYCLIKHIQINSKRIWLHIDSFCLSSWHLLVIESTPIILLGLGLCTEEMHSRANVYV